MINPDKEKLQKLKAKSKKSQDDFCEAQRLQEIAEASLRHLKRMGQVELEAQRAAELVKDRAPKQPIKPPEAYKMRAPRDYALLNSHTPGIWLVEQMAPVGHAHIPIAAYVTSYARVQLYNQLHRNELQLPAYGSAQHHAPLIGGRGRHTTYYCDTDGFATGDPALPVSDELGDIKLDKVFRWAHFQAPKLYCLRLRNPKQFDDGQEQFEIVKAKGFSRLCDCLQPLPIRKDEACPKCGFTRKSRSLTSAGYEHLIGVQSFGDGVSGRRFCPDVHQTGLRWPAYSQRLKRMRELWKGGETHPDEYIVEKRVTGNALTKREFFADGSSKAWDYERLLELKDRGRKIVPDDEGEDVSDADFITA